MRFPFRLLPLVLLPFLLAACTGMGISGSAKPADIRYYYDDIFATYDRDMRISSTGDVVIQERRGTKASDFRRVTGKLSPEQLSSLQATFRGWSDLKPFYSSDVNPLIQITYDGHMVQTSNLDRTPTTFRDAQTALNTIANAILPPPAPAPAPASAPATPTAPK